MDEAAHTSRRSVQAAFSLMELIIVIAIIGILVALLIPGVSRVQDALHMTQCRANLYTIWQAYGVWRSNNEGRVFNGGSWIGRLMPYVEYQVDVFKCPARQAMTPRIEGFEYEVVDSESERGQALIESDEDWADAYPPVPADSCFEFEVWWQVGGEERQATGIRSDRLVCAFSLDNPAHCRRTEMGNRVLYEVEDMLSWASPAYHYDDIKFYLYYDNRGRPTTIELLREIHPTSMSKMYIADFLVNGEVFIKNWYQHIGETFELTSATNPGGGFDGGGRTRWNPETQKYETYSRPLIVLADYALSVGTYERRDGSQVRTMDPKLFLILDFAYGRPLADFNQGGLQADDDWDQYFFTDPQRWRKEYSDIAKNGWQTYQSLRHYGQANVLFSDGHVDTLAPEELNYLNPRWVYHGK